MAQALEIRGIITSALAPWNFVIHVRGQLAAYSAEGLTLELRISDFLPAISIVAFSRSPALREARRLRCLLGRALRAAPAPDKIRARRRETWAHGQARHSSFLALWPPQRGVSFLAGADKDPAKIPGVGLEAPTSRSLVIIPSRSILRARPIHSRRGRAPWACRPGAFARLSNRNTGRRGTVPPPWLEYQAPCAIR